MTRHDVLSPRYALLGLLMRGPTHGYELHQQCEHELGTVWRIGLSRMYALLKDLEADGLVESRVEPQETRPARKVYDLTPAGREDFERWVRQPVVSTRDIRVLFLAKLYFLRQLGMGGVDALVEAQKAVCRAKADGVAREMEDLHEGGFDRLVMDFRLHQLQAIGEWLDGCCQRAFE